MRKKCEGVAITIEVNQTAKRYQSPVDSLFTAIKGRRAVADNSVQLHRISPRAT